MARVRVFHYTLPQECGLKLTEVSPKGALAMFETLRSVLHSGKISSRIQYMIEVLFAIRKDKFKVSSMCISIARSGTRYTFLHIY